MAKKRAVKPTISIHDDGRTLHYSDCWCCIIPWVHKSSAKKCLATSGWEGWIERAVVNKEIRPITKPAKKAKRKPTKPCKESSLLAWGSHLASKKAKRRAKR